MSEDPNDWGIGTRLTRGGLARSANMEMAEALYLTQGYVYDSAESADARFSGEEPGFVYTRYGNPTVKMFEDRLALLEGAEACKATATGMAAMHLAFMGLVKAGDHVVAGRALFGSCRWILQNWAPRFGVESTLVHGPDLDAWRAAVRPNTKVFLIETPANPLLEVCDIAGIVAIAREIGARVVVDNVFATPIFQSAAEAGRRHRLLFRDQTYRRRRPGDGRRDPWRRGLDGGSLQGPGATSRAGAVAVQRLGAAEGTGDARPARAGAERGRRRHWPTSSRRTRGRAGVDTRRDPTTPSTMSPCAR